MNTDETPTRATFKLPIIPLRNTVVYPDTIMPVDLGRPKSLAVAMLASHEENFTWR